MRGHRGSEVQRDESQEPSPDLMNREFTSEVPNQLWVFGVISAEYEWLLMVSPCHSASNLITSAVSGELNIAMTIAGCLYLTILSAALSKFAVYPRFKDNAARE